MNLPTLLVPMTIQFGVRYLLRTGLLEEIKEFARVVVVLSWDDSDLKAELASQGFEVHVIPKVRTGIRYGRIRKQIHQYHFDHVGSPTTSIDQRRDELGMVWHDIFRTRLRRLCFRGNLKIPSKINQLIGIEKCALWNDTNYEIFADLVKQIRPDALFCLTPYYIEEEFLVRAASQLGAQTSAAILSFDNLTTRPRIPILFDSYYLWNDHNRRELLRIYPAASDKEIVIVGAPQFDFYYDKTYIWSELLWHQRLGIPADRPVILYGAGPESIAPLEPHWVSQLDDAVENNEIRGKPVILLRRHPVDAPDRWFQLRNKAKHIIFDDPWKSGKDIIGKTNISRYDIEKLASTLFYSSVHINASSTMTIDGAIFDKPQIGPAYDDRPGRKYDRAMNELYKREHYLPITLSGGLELAHSREELTNLINSAIEKPERLSEERRKMVREICTFNDGHSARRVIIALKKFLVLN